MPSDKLPLLSFSNPAAFKRWLAAQPLNSQGAWLKFAKKGAAKATLNKSDAIDLALAHGGTCAVGRQEQLHEVRVFQHEARIVLGGGAALDAVRGIAERRSGLVGAPRSLTSRRCSRGTAT